VTALTPWPTIQPRRLVWEKHSHTDGPCPEVWYTPIVDRDVTIDERDTGWYVFYGAGYGRRRRAGDLLASSHTLILGLGGWDAVVAEVG
jgi:hypothetical protein